MLITITQLIRNCTKMFNFFNVICYLIINNLNSMSATEIDKCLYCQASFVNTSTLSKSSHSCHCEWQLAMLHATCYFDFILFVVRIEVVWGHSAWKNRKYLTTLKSVGFFLINLLSKLLLEHFRLLSTLYDIIVLYILIYSWG